MHPSEGKETSRTNLSKAFDCLPHDLIIAKLNSGGFNLSAIKLIDSYLTKRKQRAKINQLYSSWKVGVPQGSILGPILFHTFLSDLFLIVYDIDFTNDKAIYKEHENIDDLTVSLQDASARLFELLKNKFMTLLSQWKMTKHLVMMDYQKSFMKYFGKMSKFH